MCLCNVVSNNKLENIRFVHILRSDARAIEGRSTSKTVEHQTTLTDHELLSMLRGVQRKFFHVEVHRPLPTQMKIVDRFASLGSKQKSQA